MSSPSNAAPAQLPSGYADDKASSEIGTLVRKAWAMPITWHRRAKRRRELSELDAAQLRDTGLDPALIRHECAKPFWRP